MGSSGSVHLPDAVCLTLPPHPQVPREPAAFDRPSGIAVLGGGSSWAHLHWSLGRGMDRTQLGLAYSWEWTRLQARPPSGAHCPLSCLSFSVSCPLQAGNSLGDGSSVLDFVSVKSYSDVSLDISMLGSLGRLCRERPPVALWLGREAQLLVPCFHTA